MDSALIMAFNGGCGQERLYENWLVSSEHAEERQNPGEDITTAKGPTVGRETCPHGSFSHWLQRRIDPQDSHSIRYRKWGKGKCWLD